MKTTPMLLSIAASACLSWAGCGDKEEAAATDKGALDVGPEVGVLELPVSLRSDDTPPADARKVDASLGGLRVDGKPVVAFESGKVPAAELSGDVIGKLESALSSGSKKTLALTTHASLPYETAARVLATARKAGFSQLYLQVRKPGGSTTPGFLLVQSFDVTPRTDDEVPLPSVEARSWDEMTAAWQGLYDACKTAQTGNCAYVPTEPAKGGKLKLVLFAAGQGVNVNFVRVGVSPEQLAAEAEARKAAVEAKKAEAEKAAKKDKKKKKKGKGKEEDMASASSDLVAELTDTAPASEASFQFRSREVLEGSPSAVTAMMQPLCGKRACGAVVSAEEQTLMVRVVSLIGAVYADGAAPPVLSFELPWTKKPVPPPAPAAPAAAPAAP